MNGVIGMTNLLRDTTLDDDQTTAVNVIHQSGSALLRIINDILDFSKIEAGKFEIHAHEFEVRPLVHDTMDLVTDAAAEKGLAVDCEVSAAVPNVVDGDAGRIRQVLLNFLSNAVKYSSEGRITMTVTATVPENSITQLRIDVHDQGMGISPEAQEQLFESFSRVDSHRTRHIAGTGLGLAICRRLARLMDGDVGVSSVVGRGSTFWFTVPVRVSPRTHLVTSSRDPAGMPVGRFGRPRVLVVDDNAINRLVSTKLLEKLNCRVDTGVNGVEALEAIARDPYDLVLMDCHMPILDGYEATAAIRQLDSDRARIPVIALTAGAMAGEREKCLAAGMNDYIAKPVTREQLVAVLTRWLSETSADGGGADDGCQIGMATGADDEGTARTASRVA